MADSQQTIFFLVWLGLAAVLFAKVPLLNKWYEKHPYLGVFIIITSGPIFLFFIGE